MGTVRGVNVNVRSGGSTSHYACTRLSSPAKVKVVGELGGWVKILPPPGAFSVISRKYVRPDDAGVLIRLNVTPNHLEPFTSMGKTVYVGCEGEADS